MIIRNVPVRVEAKDDLMGVTNIQELFTLGLYAEEGPKKRAIEKIVVGGES